MLQFFLADFCGFSSVPNFYRQLHAARLQQEDLFWKSFVVPYATSVPEVDMFRYLRSGLEISTSTWEGLSCCPELRAPVGSAA